MAKDKLGNYIWDDYGFTIALILHIWAIYIGSFLLFALTLPFVLGFFMMSIVKRM